MAQLQNIRTPIRKKTFVLGGFILLALIILPITLFFFQQQQVTRSNAEKTVDITFEPSVSQTSPELQIPAGSTFSLDVYVDPGANSVSYVKLEMLYDQTKFKPAGGFIPDQNIFSQVVEGPIDQPGKLTATLSIGTDLTKALKTKTKIGTLSLKALESASTDGTSVISFGDGSQALSVSGNSSYGENVIASTQPVSIQLNKPNLTCGSSPSDVMLVMDTSDSMKEPAGSTGSKLSQAESSAKSFVDLVSNTSSIRVGLTTFDIGAKLRMGLTSDFTDLKSMIDEITTGNQTCMQCGIDIANQEISAHKRPNVKNVVILLSDGEAINIENHKGYVSKDVAEKAAMDAAVYGHKTNGTIFYTIGLGSGKEVDQTFLQNLAKNTGGDYYYSPTTDQLNSIYQLISQTLTGGSVTGVVFNDANSNGVYEPTEPGIPGVLLQLYPLNSNTPQALISTSSDGTYNLQHLCNGTYTIKQMIPTTWKQTLPSDIRGYTFNMINGKAVSDQNFGDTKLPRCSDNIDNDGNGATDRADSTCHTDGNPNNPGSYEPTRDGEHGNSTCSDSKDNNGNGLIDGEDPKCHVDGNANNPSSYDETRDEGLTPTATPTAAPTATLAPSPIATPTPTLVPSPSASPTAIPTSPTPTPNGSAFAINFLLHGIGNSGDNANPTAASLSNKTPLHPTRDATGYLFDINNKLVATAAGSVQYSSTSGSFTGKVYADSQLPAGKYTIKVRTDFHLTRLIPGILTISANQTTVIPDTTLVAGDTNNDNQLDILDYNMLLDCYSDLAPATNCSATKKVMTDLNDDNSVNQFDYNLFLREISTQPGE
jgi:Mg-chelatase subunit ChlD